MTHFGVFIGRVIATMFLNYSYNRRAEAQQLILSFLVHHRIFSTVFVCLFQRYVFK